MTDRKVERQRAPSEHFITASELATFVYCRRAWWLRHVRGHAPANRAALRRGREAHSTHARRVDWARRIILLGWALLLAGAGLVVVSLRVHSSSARARVSRKARKASRS